MPIKSFMFCSIISTKYVDVLYTLGFKIVALYFLYVLFTLHALLLTYAYMLNLFLLMMDHLGLFHSQLPFICSFVHNSCLFFSLWGIIKAS